MTKPALLLITLIPVLGGCGNKESSGGVPPTFTNEQLAHSPLAQQDYKDFVHQDTMNKLHALQAFVLDHWVLFLLGAVVAVIYQLSRIAGKGKP